MWLVYMIGTSAKHCQMGNIKLSNMIQLIQAMSTISFFVSFLIVIFILFLSTDMIRIGPFWSARKQRRKKCNAKEGWIVSLI